MKKIFRITTALCLFMFIPYLNFNSNAETSKAVSKTLTGIRASSSLKTNEPGKIIVRNVIRK